MRTTIRTTLLGAALTLGFLAGGLGLACAGDARPDKAVEGQIAPNLVVSGWKNSKELNLDGLKGSVVVLKFWATWCGPCKSTLPHFNEIATKTYAGKKVVVIGIHAQKDCDKMSDFMDRNKFAWIGAKDDTGATGKAYGAKELPYNVLIDKKGIVRKLDADIKETTEIDKLLAE